MRNWKRLSKISLIAAFAFIAMLVLLPDAGTAIYVEGGEWIRTPEAVERTAAGECGTRLCRELCIFGQPTGDFMCFSW